MAYKVKTAKNKYKKILKNITLKRKQSRKSKQNRKGKKALKGKQTRKSRKIIKNTNQYGGNFNAEEIQQLRQALQNMNFFTDDEINGIIKKQNLSSQRFAGPYFVQLLDQLQPGNFRDKTDFMNWVNNADDQEEEVETDEEYSDTDNE